MTIRNNYVMQVEFCPQMVSLLPDLCAYKTCDIAFYIGFILSKWNGCRWRSHGQGHLLWQKPYFLSVQQMCNTFALDMQFMDIMVVKPPECCRGDLFTATSRHLMLTATATRLATIQECYTWFVT